MNSLMERIKVKSFLSYSTNEKLQLIQSVRSIRSTALEQARIKKSKGRTKSATKNLIKKGKIIDPAKTALAALSKLTPAQLEKITNMFT